jgi:hypothetical protein
MTMQVVVMVDDPNDLPLWPADNLPLIAALLMAARQAQDHGR